MNKVFSEETATADELWEWCTREYKSRSLISQLLIDRFFSEIGASLKTRLQPGDTVLEVGCGAGESAQRLYRMLPNQIFQASEFDQRYVRKLEKLGLPFPVRQESVYDLQRADNSIDCLIMLEVMEHLENPEAALREIFRVAKKTVVLSVPNEPLWRILNILRGKYIKDWGNTPGHMNHWSPRSFAELIKKIGEVSIIKKPVPWILVVANKIKNKS